MLTKPIGLPSSLSAWVRRQDMWRNGWLNYRLYFERISHYAHVGTRVTLPF